MPHAWPVWIANSLADSGGWLGAEALLRALAETGLSSQELALAMLPEASARAHAPVSGFAVGAVALVLGRDGREALALGANFECVGASLSSTVHAEQAVTHLARSHGARRLLALALSADPCGHCRQFLLEVEGAEELCVLLADGSSHQFSALIPHSFQPSALGRRPELLGAPREALRLRDGSTDDLVRDAFEAARASYTPYSRAPAGVALCSVEGRIFTGSRLESVAFNPSLGAMSAALSSMAMAQASVAGFAPPVRAVLVECVGLASERPQAEALLAALAPRVGLEFHVAEAT